MLYAGRRERVRSRWLHFEKLRIQGICLSKRGVTHWYGSKYPSSKFKESLYPWYIYKWSWTVIVVHLWHMERRTYVLDLQVKRNITEKAEEDGSEKGKPGAQWKGSSVKGGHPGPRSGSVGDCPVMSDRIKGQVLSLHGCYKHEIKNWDDMFHRKSHCVLVLFLSCKLNQFFFAPRWTANDVQFFQNMSVLIVAIVSGKAKRWIKKYFK